MWLCGLDGARRGVVGVVDSRATTPHGITHRPLKYIGHNDNVSRINLLCLCVCVTISLVHDISLVRGIALLHDIVFSDMEVTK